MLQILIKQEREEYVFALGNWKRPGFILELYIFYLKNESGVELVSERNKSKKKTRITYFEGYEKELTGKG